ncbi:MAG: site-2 protease family protein [Candidatus Anstonellales archaeon]
MRSIISVEEIVNIAVSVLAISLALTFHEGGGLGIKPPTFIFFMGVFTITVGTGFVLHELAHKFVAMRYGAWAEFRAWPTGLVLMLVMAILPIGFLFLAPGAVWIYSPHITRRQNGIISVAGPVTNIILALIFVGFSVIAPSNTLQRIAILGAYVNSFLAFFNMIPIFPLDGSKVLAWDWKVWLLVIGISALMAF